MNRVFEFRSAMLLCVLAGAAYAPAAATTPKAVEATASSATIVQLYVEELAARNRYADRVAAARKARDRKVNAAAEAAVKQAAAQGKDPTVAKRDATGKALEAAKPEYDAAVRAARQELDTAIAEARKKAADSGS